MSEPYYQDEHVTLWHGDCLDVLADLPTASVDAVITDPPYNLTTKKKGGTGAASVNLNTPAGRARITTGGFMGRGWDDYDHFNGGFQGWCHAWATECLRVLKPGGHLLAFGGTRTWHRLACAVEDAGFEMRDSIAWLYGSGFPKSLNVSKAIDKAAGADREVVGIHIRSGNRGATQGASNGGTQGGYNLTGEAPLTAPATPDAERWQGWGTALKPAFEPVVVARKPLIGTVAATVLAHGTGALNIAACRISASEQSPEWPTSQGSAGSSRGDSTTCTCPELADDQTIHSPSTPLPASSEPSPARRNDPLASAQSDGLDSSPLPDSQGDYRSSCRSGGAPAPLAGVADRASAPQPLDAPEPDAHSRAGSRIPTSQSMPCPKCTAPNVERRRDTLVRPAIRRDDNTVLGKGLGAGTQVEPSGRWPANVVLDESQAEVLDQQSGELSSGANPTRRGSDKFRDAYGDFKGQEECTPARGADTGGASRFFPTFRYEAKAPTSERPKVNGTAHPTVKPLDLMRWLVRLVTPPGGVVVDPFAGSGTTVEACILEGLHCLAIERESDYLPLIVSRIHRRRDPVEAIKITGDDMGLFAHLEGEGA